MIKEASAEQEALRLIDEGNGCEDEGQLAKALQLYEAAIHLAPNLARAHLNRGNALLEIGDMEAAVTAYAEALVRNPDYAAAHYNMGNAYARSSRPEAALGAYRKAILLKPDFADAEVALGAVLESLGQPEEALESYRRALKANPGYAGAHCNLGNVLKDVGQLDDAVASYRRALELAPDFVDAHYNLGNALKDLGRLDDALASYRLALAIKPDFAEAHYNMGSALKELGRLEDAAANYRRAVHINSRYVEAHSNLGGVMQDLGRHDDALASYRRALEIKPDFAEGHNNLGNALKNLGRLEDAVTSYGRALQINPEFSLAHSNMANALQDLGRLGDAVTSYRQALAINPDFAGAHTSLLFCLSHMEELSASELFGEHCRFGAQFEAPLRASWPAHGNTREPDRCLQVGIVSGDLREHAVAYFIEPVLAQLARVSTLALHAYYNHAVEGQVTRRLRGYFQHWHAIAHVSDAALAQQIGDDGIDILIDLSGHTGENRLLCFARKPAPVQVSWLGYPGTTGLSAMDYYFTDRYLLPPGAFDSQFTEKLVHLPANAPFMPDASAPAVNVLPALSKGYLTFGSFNRLSKLTPSTIALWSQLLRILPEARMVLGGMPEDHRSNSLIDWFALEGIARERLSFYPRCSTAAYLALHHQVDICLDTFPYTGGTTTNHALWMGVPTLTLAGHTPPGRQGPAILGRLGLDAFVAEDVTDFVQKGLSWNGDRAALAAVRAGMRDRIERTPLRRPEVIAAGVESALRTMWQRWCAGLPPVTLDLSPPIKGKALPAIR
jgi:protein O-GlcNAc transferase